MGGVWSIITALFVLWIIGLGIHWAANVVWMLFSVAVVLLLINLFIGRRAVT